MTPDELRRPWREGQPSTFLSRGVLGGLVALTWLLTLPRLVPSTFGDHGSFVSVAERLRAGDRLFVDVWDNKDPLFYYSLALVREITPYGDMLLEIAWLALASAATVGIARVVGVPGRGATLTGWVVTPVLLTGAAYTPGMTHLPGIAVTLLIFACALHGKWQSAGALMAILLLLKLILIPIALVLALSVAAWPPQPLGRLGRAFLTFLGTAALFMGLLVLRGESHGYLSTQLGNVHYAGGSVAESRWGESVGHLLRVAPINAWGGALTILASIVALTIIGAPARSPLGDRSSARTVLWRAVVASLATAIMVLGLTGLWIHHLQVLYVPGVLSLLLLATWPAIYSLGAVRVTTSLLLFGYLIGGAVHPYWYLEDVRTAGSRLTSLAGPSSEARELLKLAPKGDYARLGTNDIGAHARGLESWTLACRNFQQYPFDPPSSLEDVTACLRSVDAVIVSSSLAPEPSQPSWNSFVARARDSLDRYFTCKRTGFGRVCTRGLSSSLGRQPG